MAKIDSAILDEKFNEIKELFSKFPQTDSDENKIQYISMCQKKLTDYRNFLKSAYGTHPDIVEKAQALCDSCYLTASLRSLDIETFFTFCTWQLSQMEYWFYACVPDNAYHLSITVIVRNEDYLEEWIRYHLLVGVEHFYIYDNESTNDLKQHIQKYIDNGTVTYTYYPGDCVQLKAYLDAIHLHKYETKWMAIIDADEYIVPIEDKSIPMIIDEIEQQHYNRKFRLADFNLGGIGINWRIYGTSFHKAKMPGMLIENYMYRAPDDYEENVHIKTICNPRVVIGFSSPHSCTFINNGITISENGSAIIGPFFYDGSCSKLRINHYFCRSEEEYLKKLKRGWPDQEHVELPRERVENDLKKACQVCNEVYDPIMNRFIEKLKQANTSQEENENG